MQKVARIVGIVALVVVIFAAIITSVNNKPSNSEKVHVLLSVTPTLRITLLFIQT